MKIKQLFSSGIKALKANLFKNYSVPLSVYIALTERCPHRCIYCNYSALSKEKKEEITTEDALDIINELKEAGCEKLHISGGEPLIRDDLGKIIDYAKEKGMFVGISASGILIPERIDMLKNIDVVLLSLDGEEKTNDEIRGKGSFKQVMEAISALRKNGVRFWINTVLTKKNLSSLDFILELAKKNNTYANFILLQYHSPEYESNLPTQEAISDLIPSQEDLRNALNYLLLKKRRGERIGSTKSYLEFLINWENYNLLYSPKRYNIKCFAGRLFCHITSSGLLYACGLAMGRVAGMDIKSLGLKRAFTQAKIPQNCNSCCTACNLENNLILSLSPSAIFNWLNKL